MKNLINVSLFILIILIFKNTIAREINKTIFTINETNYTMIDLNERIYYLKSINKNS